MEENDPLLSYLLSGGGGWRLVGIFNGELWLSGEMTFLEEAVNRVSGLS